MFKNSKGQWDWFKILLPIIIVVFGGLSNKIYVNLYDLVSGKANAKEVELHVADLKNNIKTKADEADVKALLILFEERSKVLQESARDQKVINKETLKELQELNINVKLLQKE